MRQQQTTECAIQIPSPKLEREYSQRDHASAVASVTVFPGIYISCQLHFLE